jgi:hypothetical protein
MKIFGSALEIKLPKEGAGWHWIDCSSILEVPDHQELFMLKDRNDMSIIIEILEESPMSVEDHFEELAHCNEASKTGPFTKGGGGDWGSGWQLVREEKIFIG